MGALDLLKIPSLVRRSGEAASKAKPFYSTVDRAISEITQNKGSGEQFLGMILNKKGVKPQEIKDRGLDKLLTGKMTKADVQRIAAENPPPQVRESVLGEKGFQQEVDRRVEEEIGEVVRRNLSAMSPRDRANKFTLAEVEDKAYLREPKIRRQIEEEVRDDVGFATKYEDYTIPGGKNYREIKFQLPLGKEKTTRDARFREIADEMADATPEQFAALHAERSKLYNEDLNNRAFLSSHYEEPNLLAHARVSDRTGPNGEKIMHIEEVQSDWHQQGRKAGYKPADLDSQINALISKRESETSVPERMKMMEEIQSLQRIQESGVPDAPFKSNWHELVMKRLMDDAARNGYDKVLITPGARQVKRYPDPSKTPEEALRGFAGFYDDMLPGYLNSYGKKYGASVQPHSFSIEGEEIPLHSFDINPQMRGEIVEKGQSLYQMAPPAIGAGAMMEPEEKKDGGEIKASPKAFGQDALGRIGQVAEKLGISLQEAMGILAKEGNSPVKAFIGNMLLSDPLKSAGTALQDYTGTPREITADQPYSRLISGKGMNMRLDPRVLDVAQFAAPIASVGAKAGVKGAKALGPTAGRMAEDYLLKTGQMLPVMKPKGGNWLEGNVENSMKGLKRGKNATPQEVAETRAYLDKARATWNPENQRQIDQMEREFALLRSNESINQFVDKQLTRYVKNEMGTAEDPVRAVADRGMLHYEPPATSVSAAKNRRNLGLPMDPVSTTPYGQAWENAADASIEGAPYRMSLPMVTPETAPDALRALGGEFAVKNPDAMAYSILGDKYNDVIMGRSLGFNHLIDELRNATNPASGLPRELLLKPESLSRLSVPQAVERVAKINEWRAAQKAEADLARARNPATVLHKEYPDKGYSWQELKQPKDLPIGFSVVENKTTETFQVVGPDGKPLSRMEFDTPDEAKSFAMNSNDIDKSLDDALKYEGEQMGHCVGGYCPDVASGKSRIFSLRDAKGQPHVTIETRPSQSNRAFNEVNSGVPNPPDSIFQIKGKSNKAPNEEYLPYVQDFVRSGKWGEIGDSQNAGLRRYGDVFNVNEQRGIEAAGEAVPEHDWLTGEDIQRLHNVINPEGKRLKYDARGNIVGDESGMKRGGAVKNDCDCNVSQDAMRLAVLNKRLKGK